ncbi:hypothetical protein y223_00009 [Bordetella phage PY223]
MNDVQQYTGPALVNPFERADVPAHVNAGTVMIEEARAIAEVKGKLSVAKMFPRNEALAFQKAMDSCRRPSMAAAANWKYKRAGQQLSGPSIRLAEELARCWGNIDYGIRELSRKDGVSEMEAYCWDMETNTISSQKFTVRHLRDKTEGAAELTSERDIYEVTANMGARRLRARILAILPPDLVESAVEQCRKTNANEGAELPIADRIKNVVTGFGKFGITVPMLEAYLGHKLDTMLPEEFADLTEVRNSIKDGRPAGEFFGSASLAAPGGDVPAQPGAAGANDNQGQQQEQQKPAARRGRQPKAAEQQQPQGQQGQAQAQQQADAAPAAQEAAQQAQEPAPTLAQPAAQTPAASAPAGGLKEVF